MIIHMSGSGEEDDDEEEDDSHTAGTSTRAHVPSWYRILHHNLTSVYRGQGHADDQGQTNDGAQHDGAQHRARLECIGG